jgi:tetratricopeptide (TPR) repeat protein
MNDWELFKRQLQGFRAAKRATEALGHLEQGLGGDLCTDKPWRRVILWRWIGEIQLQLKNLDAAYDALKEALNLKDPEVNHCFTARILWRLGAVFWSKGQMVKALECGETAAPIFGEDPNWGLERVKSLNSLARTYIAEERLDDALNCFQTASTAAVPPKSVRPINLFALLRLGSAFKNSGRFGPALRCAEMILRNASGEKVRASALNTKGITLRCLGRNREAVEAHTEAYELAEKTDDPKTEFYCALGLGQAYAAQGQWGDTERLFAKALEAQRKVEDLKQQGRIRDGLDPQVTRRAMVTACLNGGNLPLAEKYADSDALDHAVQGFLELARARKAAKERRDFSAHLSAARQAYEALLEDAKTYGLAFDRFASNMGLGAVHELQEDYTAAESFYREAVKISEDMRSSAYSPEESERFFNTGYEGFHRLAPYEGLERVLFAQERYEAAFLLSEYTKARSFMDLLAGPVNPETAEAQKPVLLGALDDSALRDDEWGLAYNVTETGLFIHLVHGQEVADRLFDPKWPREKLKRLVDDFRRPLLAAVAENDLRKALLTFPFDTIKELSSVLTPQKMLDKLNGSFHITIIPDEFLGELPFEMLILREGSLVKDVELPQYKDAEFFGDKRCVSYYQSINALTLARRKRAANSVGAKALLIADPAYNETKWRLGETKKIQDIMERVFPGASEAFIDTHASKEVFETQIKNRLSEFHTVVFGTHGDYGTFFNEPALFLGPSLDERCSLLMHEVAPLKMNADLVALVACNSGMGETVYGEGVMGMGRAFQCAGARNVLMSLWSVIQITSVQLVNEFLGFRVNHSDAEALKLAREELRKNEKNGWDHPLFWAPFVLVGDGGRMNRTVV